MTPTKKISIVIPAHNEEHNLEATIQAVLAQDYPSFEVIVVNNASTDNTRTIALKYPIKLVDEPRKGILFAREGGRQVATGDIIANIDADCLPDPDWLYTGSNLFNKDNIVAITGPYDYYDGGNFFRYSSLYFQKLIYPIFNRLFQLSFLHRGATIIGGNNFIRANILNQVGGYNTSISFYGEDTDTAKRVARFGKVVFSPKLIMKTSARRFKSEGTLNLAIKYWFYFFKTIGGR